MGDTTYVRVWDGLRKERDLDLSKITTRKDLVSAIGRQKRAHLDIIKKNPKLARKLKLKSRVKSLTSAQKFAANRKIDSRVLLKHNPITQASGRAGWVKAYSRTKPRAFSSAEASLLQRHAGKKTSEIMKIFSERGFARTYSSIATKRSRLGV